MMGTGILGPFTEAEVPAVILDGGKLNSTGGDVRVLLVDCSCEVVPLLRLPRAFEEIAIVFDMDSPFSLPDRGVLQQIATEWIEGCGPQSALGFYTAEEQQTELEQEVVDSLMQDGLPSPSVIGTATPGSAVPATPAKAKRAAKAKQPTSRATPREPGA